MIDSITDSLGLKGISIGTILLPQRRGKLQHYLLALTLAVFALWMRLAIAPVEAGLQYLTFFPAVAIAAIVGGYRAGLLAMASGLLFATTIFTPPYYSFSWEVWQRSFWSNLVFLIGSGIVTLAIEAMHRYREHATNELEKLKSINSLQKTHKVFIENALEGFWLVDTQGYLREVNQSYADMVGYPVAELLGMHISQLDAQESTEQIERHIAQVMTMGSDLFETRHRHKNGHEIDVEVSVNYSAELHTFFAFFRNISERKQAEQALRIAAVTFEIDEAIMVTDAHAHIIRVNRAFERITGFSLQETVGRTPAILKSGRHEPAFYREMWRRLLDEGHWSGEIWDRRKNGQIYPKWLTITALRDDQQHPTGYVAFFNDITEQKKNEAAIQHLAFYDPLTKLPNRRLLQERFQQALAASTRNAQYGAVLFLDMDRFKTLNDTLGHDYGDLLLIEVARRLNGSVRDVDTVARLGGDEFMVLIEELGANFTGAQQKAAMVAEKIRLALTVAYQLNSHVYQSSPSIGVCLFCGCGLAVDELIKRADTALYQAKNAGRNTVRFYDARIHQAVASQTALESDLRSALANDQLRLYYQIQVDNNNCSLGAEALLRWQHPQRGLLLPAEFLPIAEESPLIQEIDTWVLHNACQQLRLWREHEWAKHLRVAVNTSLKQFKSPNFLATVKTATHDYPFDTQRLRLELTEDPALIESNDNTPDIAALLELGIGLALDDFGNGGASLTCLQRLRFDQIKINRDLVRDMTTQPDAALMVQAIINLANDLRLQVLAEGVESEAQLALLKAKGCPAFQGYLFGEPLPVDEFESSLQKFAIA